LVSIAAANALTPNQCQDISCDNAGLSSLCSEMTLPTKITLSLWVKIGHKVLNILIFLKKVSGRQ